MATGGQQAEEDGKGGGATKEGHGEVPDSFEWDKIDIGFIETRANGQQDPAPP
jgi:hypothetical protein